MLRLRLVLKRFASAIVSFRLRTLCAVLFCAILSPASGWAHWSEQLELTASAGAATADLNVPVAFSEDRSTIVVGQVGSNAGQRNLSFVKSLGFWSQQAEWMASDDPVHDGPGVSVAVSGSTSVMGALYRTIASNTNQGAVYAFGNSGTVSTITTLSANANPSSAGQVVSFTATVSGSSPTGTVTFYNGTTPIGTATLAGAQATLGDSFSANGNYSITAIYSGDSNNQTSTSPVLVEYVKTLPLATTTTVESSALTINAGQSVTFTAAVSWAHGAPPDGELITFKDTISGITLGAAPLASSVATLTVSSLNSGTYAVKAKYAGDATFAASDASLTETVEPAASTTVVSSSADPAAVGQSITFTATVTGDSPSGTVTFSQNGVAVATESLSGGQASYTKSFGSTGTKAIAASYSGDINNQTSTSATLSEAINPVPATSTTLTSSLNPSAMNQSVTFTATVTGGNGAPTGTVTFTINGTPAATVPISIAQATFSSTLKTATTLYVTASYSGDVNNGASTSPAVRQVVSYPADTVVTLNLTRPPISGTSAPTESFVVTAAPTTTPARLLILLAGATGNIQLTPNGTDGSLEVNSMNTLVRSRWNFAAYNFVVLSVDAATDFKLLPNVLTDQRSNPAYISDLVQVISWARTNYPGVPVWIVGISRGTGGAFVGAANAPPAGPDGLVLASPVNNTTDPDSVLKANLAAITVPVLLYGNLASTCNGTLPSADPAVLAALTAAPVTGNLNANGGLPAMGDDCKALAPHAFFGIEQTMVNDVSTWVAAH